MQGDLRNSLGLLESLYSDTWLNESLVRHHTTLFLLFKILTEVVFNESGRVYKLDQFAHLKIFLIVDEIFFSKIPKFSALTLRDLFT